MQRQPANVCRTAPSEPCRSLLLWPILVGVLVAITPAVLRAQPADPDLADEIPLQVVRVSLVGAVPAPAFAERIASWFESDTRVEVHREPRLDANRILGTKQRSGVYVWIELRSPTLARVYFVVVEADTRQRFLLRDVALEEGLDELGVERLAQVLYASVVALQQGRLESSQAEVERQLESSTTTPVDDDPPVAPEPTPTPEVPALVPEAPAPPRTCPLGTALGAGYGVNTRGDEGLAHGPEVWAALLGGCHRVRLGGFLSGRYLIPVELSAEDVTVAVTGGRLRAGGMLQPAGGERLRFELGAGFGADIVRYEPTADAGFTAADEATELRPAATVLLGSRWRAGAVAIALLAELDVQPQSTHYDVARQTGPQTAIVPWRVQPGVTVLIGRDGPRR